MEGREMRRKMEGRRLTGRGEGGGRGSKKGEKEATILHRMHREALTTHAVGGKLGSSIIQAMHNTACVLEKRGVCRRFKSVFVGEGGVLYKSRGD
jgi:hypothetical protein